MRTTSPRGAWRHATVRGYTRVTALAAGPPSTARALDRPGPGRWRTAGWDSGAPQHRPQCSPAPLARYRTSLDLQGPARTECQKTYMSRGRRADANPAAQKSIDAGVDLCPLLRILVRAKAVNDGGKRGASQWWTKAPEADAGGSMRQADA